LFLADFVDLQSHTVLRAAVFLNGWKLTNVYSHLYKIPLKLALHHQWFDHLPSAEIGHSVVDRRLMMAQQTLHHRQTSQNNLCHWLCQRLCS
jgi:hypothetical protein